MPGEVPVCTGWITTTQLTSACANSAASGLPEETLQSAIDAATEWLYIKSGQMFAGQCEETVRPYSEPTLFWHRAYYAGWAWSSGWWNGSWWNGGWGWGCGCGDLSEVNLDYWPIIEITEVKVDGNVLDPSEYRLDEKRLLVRLPDADGNRRFWPDCQRMDLPDTEADTWSVTLTYGQEPTPLALAAVKELAYELLKPCIGAECNIPVNVRSVNRQGVSYQLVGFEGQMPEVKTGLRNVDMFLNAYNPLNIGRSATIWSPDIEPRARRIGS